MIRIPLLITRSSLVSRSVRILAVLALGSSAACVSVPPFASPLARARSTFLAPSAFAIDSLDILHCAQVEAARGGFFAEDTTGTVLVRRLSTDTVFTRGIVPVRRPVPVRPPGGVAGPARGTEAVRSTGSRRDRIVLRPTVRASWGRPNARAAGSSARRTRELVELVNSRCTMRRAAV